MRSKSQVVVIGAGAFGGWTALYLLRRGAQVTLLDAWGPGNPDRLPAAKPASCAAPMVRTSLTRKWPLALCDYGRNTRPAGRDSFSSHRRVMDSNLQNDRYERSSLPMLREAGIAYEELSRREVGQRWPQMNVEDVRWAIYESESGYLTARTACQAVVEGFQAEGGEYKQIAVSPHDFEAGIRDGLPLSDGSRLKADQFVFACGPWLSQLFPETIGACVRPTKQDVFFFGAPAGDVVLRNRSCQSGPTIATTSSMASQPPTDVDSRSPTIREARSSIRLPENE